MIFPGVFMAQYGLFTTLLMGAAIVEFGLTGISSPSWDGASDPQNDQKEEVRATQAAPASGGSLLSGVVPQDISAEEYAAAATEKLIPRSAEGGPPPGYQAPRPEMAQDIEGGVYHLDKSVRQIPGYAMKVVGEVEKHGIAALAYEDPELKRAGHELGTEVGTGIRQLMSALGKDMVSTAQESMAGARR